VKLRREVFACLLLDIASNPIARELMRLALTGLCEKQDLQVAGFSPALIDTRAVD
jgi:hypothetical protein